MKVVRIGRADPRYPGEVALRERVLLGPVGLDLAGFERLFPGVEDQFEHFVAAEGEAVTGCALLVPRFPDAAQGKLMQMAVEPARQGQGVGRALVAAVEDRAFRELGLAEVFCHARQSAYGFYEALGYRFDSPEFTEVGVPHRLMRRRAP